MAVRRVPEALCPAPSLRVRARLVRQGVVSIASRARIVRACAVFLHVQAREGKLRMLVQFEHETRWKQLPDVPTARELATTAQDKALLELAELPFLMARPFIDRKIVVYG